MLYIITSIIISVLFYTFIYTCENYLILLERKNLIDLDISLIEFYIKILDIREFWIWLLSELTRIIHKIWYVYVYWCFICSCAGCLYGWNNNNQQIVIITLLFWIWFFCFNLNSEINKILKEIFIFVHFDYDNNICLVMLMHVLSCPLYFYGTSFSWIDCYSHFQCMLLYMNEWIKLHKIPCRHENLEFHQYLSIISSIITHVYILIYIYCVGKAVTIWICKVFVVIRHLWWRVCRWMDLID